MRSQEVEMVDPISKAVEIGMDGGLLTDIDRERVAALRIVTGGLHAEFGQPFRDRFGIGELRFVLNFENHHRYLFAKKNEGNRLSREKFSG